MTFHSLLPSFTEKLQSLGHPLNEVTRSSAVALFSAAEQSDLPIPELYYDEGWLVLRWELSSRYLTSCVLPNGRIFSMIDQSDGILHDAAEFLTIAGCCSLPHATQA